MVCLEEEGHSPTQAPSSSLFIPDGQLSRHWYPPSVFLHCWWAGHTFLVHSLISVCQGHVSVRNHLQHGVQGHLHQSYTLPVSPVRWTYRGSGVLTAGIQGDRDNGRS